MMCNLTHLTKEVFMFKKLSRNLKKIWIMIFLFVTFTPALLTQCQKVIFKTIE
jgi:hypothetical protein